MLDGEERAALAVVRSLGRHGCRVHVGSFTPRSLAGGSRFAASEAVLPDPLAGSAAYAFAVRGLLEASHASVLIPMTEASTLAILAHPELFLNVVIPTSDLQHFLRASDKALVLSLAAELGIAVPRQWSLAPSDVQMVDIPADQFPLVVKPSRSVVGVDGSRQKGNVAFASSPAALESMLAAMDPRLGPLLVQQRIEGPGLGVFLLRWRGELLASFAHRRIREKPPSGGVSVCSESVDLPRALLERTSSLLEALDWSGVAMVEYKHDARSGRDYLMEINPRFWGSLQLALDAGVDFPWLLLQAALGKPERGPAAWPVGIRSRWPLGEVDHLIALAANTRAELNLPKSAPGALRTLIEMLTPNRGAQRCDVLRASDLRPAWREGRKWCAALVSRRTRGRK